MTLRGALLTLTLVFGVVGCTSLDERLRQHQRHFESLSATARTAGDAWLAGTASRTYTVQALTRTHQLLEQERSSLAASPETLADPRGADLSQHAERLSRIVANTIGAVRDDDGSSVRRHLSELPPLPQESR